MMSNDGKQVTIYDLLKELRTTPDVFDEPKESAPRQPRRSTQSGGSESKGTSTSGSSSSDGSWKTINGYEPFEVVSALQKMIRRGKEFEAVYWAMELEASGNWSWLWKRLMIIAVEDIGLADPQTVILVKNLWDTYVKIREMGKGRPPEGNILVMAVLALCKAKKNREADDLAFVMGQLRKEGLRLPMPDVAIDEHTRRGKAMGRDDNFWFQEASRLKGKVVIDGNPWGEAFKDYFRNKGVKVDYPHDGYYDEDDGIKSIAEFIGAEGGRVSRPEPQEDNDLDLDEEPLEEW